MKKLIAKLVCIVLCCTIFSSCGKGAEENAPVGSQGTYGDGGEESGDGNLDEEDGKKPETPDSVDYQDKEKNPSSNDTEDTSKDMEEGNQNSTEGNPTGTQDPVQTDGEELLFPLLENYRERNIEIDPTISGKGEVYAGILLNAENKIEQYVSTRKENEYFLFCYTLNEETLTWERKAVPWSKGLGDHVYDGHDISIMVFLGEDGNYYGGSPSSAW